MFIGIWKIWHIYVENLWLKVNFYQISFKATVILVEFLRKNRWKCWGFTKKTGLSRLCLKRLEINCWMLICRLEDESCFYITFLWKSIVGQKSTSRYLKFIPGGTNVLPKIQIESLWLKINPQRQKLDYQRLKINRTRQKIILLPRGPKSIPRWKKRYLEISNWLPETKIDS